MPLSKTDIVDCLSIAVACFPNYPLEEPTIASYHLLLDELDKNTLYEAIKEVIKTSPFFPTVAQILEVANRKPTYTPPQFVAIEDARKPMPDWFKKEMDQLFQMPKE